MLLFDHQLEWMTTWSNYLFQTACIGCMPMYECVCICVCFLKYMICTLQVPNIIYKSERYLCDMNIKCRWTYTHFKTSKYQQSNSIQHNSNSAIVGRIRLKRTLRFYFYCRSTGGRNFKVFGQSPNQFTGLYTSLCALLKMKEKKTPKTWQKS